MLQFLEGSLWMTKTIGGGEKMTKIRDGLYGLCVADALGVPAECLSPSPKNGHKTGGKS